MKGTIQADGVDGALAGGHSCKKMVMLSNIATKSRTPPVKVEKFEFKLSSKVALVYSI